MKINEMRKNMKDVDKMEELERFADALENWWNIQFNEELKRHENIPFDHYEFQRLEIEHYMTSLLFDEPDIIWTLIGYLKGVVKKRKENLKKKGITNDKKQNDLPIR